MENICISKKSVIQNLIDAGCDDKMIEVFIQQYQLGNRNELYEILACHRCNLLKKLHQEQNKIDCLDYLIYTIKKNERR